jgi:hypothetical protein
VLALGALVVGATAVITHYGLRILSFQPDEWYYTELARFTARDFPGALWYPGVYGRGIHRVDQLFLAIPYAFLRTPSSYQVAHAVQAFLYASTAIPVWLLARAAGLGRAARALACTLVVAAPWGIVATSFLAEPAGYPAYAWAFYAVWCAAARPSRKVEVLAIVALAVAALSRTQLIALSPILPLAVLWQAWRVELAGSAWRQRIRELPRCLWSGHPIVTTVSLLAIVALLLSEAGLLPHGGVAALTGKYGLPELEHLSAITGRYRYYLARMIAGTGVLAAALGAAWVLRTLVRPRTRDDHALAIVCALGMLAILLSLLEAGLDERYVLFGAVPISLAFAAELENGVRTRRAGIGVWASIALGVAVVIWLIDSVSWPTTGSNYAFFGFPAGTFFGKVLLARLSTLPLRLVHPSPVRLAEIAVLLLALAWAAARRSRRAVVPAAAVIGAGAVALCAAQLIYVMNQFTTSAAADPGGKTTRELSWVDARVPAGASVTELGVGLGYTLAYWPFWYTIDFWNASVNRTAGFDPGVLPPKVPETTPLVALPPEVPEATPLTVTVNRSSGLLTVRTATKPEHPAALPRYLLVPLLGQNELGIRGRAIASNPYMAVALMRPTVPARAAWVLDGVSREGFIDGNAPARATVYQGALPRENTCASFALIAPPGFAGQLPYQVLRDGHEVAHGGLAEAEERQVMVPAYPASGTGDARSMLTIRVHWEGAVVPGTRLVGFEVHACRPS